MHICRSLSMQLSLSCANTIFKEIKKDITNNINLLLIIYFFTLLKSAFTNYFYCEFSLFTSCHLRKLGYKNKIDP